ncbi:MAG: nucleoside recognition protein [Nitrospiraceae bacterium]|nr:nucleoside recognition protein [Nitrospiraceae bacterium]
MSMILNPVISASKYLAIMIPSMALGIILVNLITNLQLLHRISWLVRPITRFGHMRDECGLSFITAFGSSAAANSILMGLYQKGKIGKRELYVASLTNSFPAVIMHLRSMLPVIVPLLGPTGLVYFGILSILGLMRTGLILLTGRVILPQKKNYHVIKRKKERPSLPSALWKSICQSKKIITRIVMVTVPVTIATFVLIDLGIFDRLAIYLRGIAEYLPIAPEGIPIIAAQFVSSIAAYTVASNLLIKGVLSGYQIIIILLIGNILATVTGLRYIVPYYIGIFGPRLGAELMVISTLLRQGLVLIAVFLLIIFR